MKYPKSLAALLAALALCSGNAHAAKVEYEATFVGPSNTAGNEIWRYDYWVTNDDPTADPIENFSVLFPLDSNYVSICDSFEPCSTSASSDPIETDAFDNLWDPVALRIDPGLSADGEVNYDSFFAGTDPIPFDTELGGFFALFEWDAGGDDPGSQPFAVFDSTFAVIAEGFTTLRGGDVVPPVMSAVPLPGTAWLFLTGLAGFGLLRRRLVEISQRTAALG
ncbi:MAG: VPLPA-CTERM sorting domain-containing protein [Pseudomonadota bacterium]